jgi:hypothetical protein
MSYSKSTQSTHGYTNFFSSGQEKVGDAVNVRCLEMRSPGVNIFNSRWRATYRLLSTSAPASREARLTAMDAGTAIIVLEVKRVIFTRASSWIKADISPAFPSTPKNVSTKRSIIYCTAAKSK